jgi:hypothetical protein
MSTNKPVKKKTGASKKPKQKAANSATVDFPSMQSMEGIFAGVGLGGRQSNAVAEAQQLMYDAWEAPTRQRAVELAQKALSISPDCADAYSFLAEQTAESMEEAIDLYTKGSRKNKFTFLGVVAPVWQGAEAQEYRDISARWQHRQAGCIGV